MEKKTVADLRAYVASFHEHEYPVKKGYIVKLLMNLGETKPGCKHFFLKGPNIAEVFNKIKVLVQRAEPDMCLNEDSTSVRIRYLDSIVKSKKRQLTAEWSSVVKLCQETFDPTFKILPASELLQPPSSLPATSTSQPETSSSVPATLATSSGPPSPKRLRFDRDCCTDKQRTISTMSTINAGLRKQLRAQRKQHKSELAKYFPREVNRAMKRKSASVNLWKTKYAQMAKDNVSLASKSKSFETSQQENTSKDEMFKTTVEELQKQLREVQVRERRLLKKVEDLKQAAVRKDQAAKILLTSHNKAIIGLNQRITEADAELVSLKDDLIEAAKDVVEAKKNEKQYHFIFRKCIYKLILSNVGVDHCSDVISYIGRTLFKKDLSASPSASVVADMAYEIGFLSDIQTGYFLHRSTATTLAWDATSLSGEHINEVHVTVVIDSEQRSLTLNLGLLAGAATSDYYQHITDSLFDVVRAYTDYYGLSYEDVKTQVFNCIKSTISDRAIVNSCVTRRLRDQLDLSLIELKCNVHPLGGIAHAARTVLGRLDREWETPGDTNRPGCIVSNLLHDISKTRYKQGTGDPGGFVTFLRENGLKPGIILRFVGNRLQVLFHMAVTVFTKRATLLKFFLTQCSRTGRLRGSICSLLENSSVLAQMQALGLFSKILTGPWMHVLYSANPLDVKMTNLQVVTKGCFNRVLKTLQKTQADPNYLLTCRRDAFGEMLDVGDLDIVSLRGVDPDNRDRLFRSIEDLARAFSDKLKGQLRDYLAGGALCNPTVEMLRDTASAPVHNMHAERALGIMDSLWRKAPNARFGFIDAKVKSLQNKTLNWLDEQAESEQSKLVDFSVSQGAKIKLLRGERERACRDARARKLVLLARKIDIADRKKVADSIKLAISTKARLASLEE